MVGLVALGAHHEEDRQRDPEAVVVHVEGPVDGDADRQRGAEADRVAGGCPSRRVKFEREGRGDGAAVSQPLGSSASARSTTTQTISDQSTWVRPPTVPQSSAGSASSAGEEEALGDQQRQRHDEADDRQAQRDGEAVAGERRRPGPSSATAVGADWLLRTPSAAGEADQRRRRRLPGGARPGRRVEPGEAGEQGAGGDRALGRGVEAELDDQRERRPGPRSGRRGAAPARARWGRSRSSGEARSRVARPEALKSPPALVPADSSLRVI